MNKERCETCRFYNPPNRFCHSRLPYVGCHPEGWCGEYEATEPQPDMARVVEALKAFAEWCRGEASITGNMNVSYGPWREEHREGRVEALRMAEARLGLLMLEQGIDLRPEKKVKTR